MRISVQGGAALLTGILLTTACEINVDDATRMARAEQAVANGEFREASIELKNVLRSDPANIAARVMLGKASLEGGDALAAAKELQRAQELGAEPHDYTVPLARSLVVLGKSDDALEFSAADLDSPADRADLNAVLGNAYLQRNDITQAEIKFNDALAEIPGHSDALVGMARVYLDQGNTQAAEEALRQVIARQSDSHAAYSALGRLQMNSAEYDSAEANFQTAIAHAQGPGLRRERMNYMAGLIDVLLAQRKAGEAQVVAAQMLQIAPDHPYALFQAARADFESGEMDDTIDKSQRVITAYPDYQPARLLLAAAAMSKENFALAEVHLRSLVSANPNNAQARKLLAQAEMSMGSPEQAFNALEPLLQDNSADARLLTMAGSASLRSGETARGLEYLTRGLEAGSADPVVQMQAASSYIAAGEIGKAIALLEQMPEAMHGEQRDFLLILARLRSGDTEGARAQATRLLEQNPGDPMGHRIMGGFHMAINEYDQAKVQFEIVRKLNPDDVGAVINLARIDVFADDLAAAENRYQQLLKEQPGSLVAMLGISQLAEKNGDLKRAVELLEQARTINPDAVQPPLLLARYYLSTNQTDLALERAEQAIAAAPNNVDAINMIGQAKLVSNRYSEALGHFQRSLQHEPNRVATHYFLAQSQQRLGLLDQARKSFEKAIEIDPSHLGARVAMSQIESRAGNYEAALVYATELQREYPDRAEPLTLIGDIQIIRGQFNDAIEAYDAAGQIVSSDVATLKRYEARNRAGRADAHELLELWLQDNPDNARVRITLAQNFQARGLNDKAVLEYQRVLDHDSENVVAQNNLAWLYSELGGAQNLKLGVEIAARAHKKLPDLGQITDTYGWLLLKQGEVRLATEKLRLALSQAPNDPDIRYHLAVALQRSGGAAEARDLLDKILSDGSSFSSREEAKSLREKL